MLTAILLLIVGLVVLIGGAEYLVRGSSSLARKAGISPLAVGLTIVAFGTSAPELVVNLFSAFKGTADIAIGNVIGSNISNILLILGICAIITPLTIKKTTVWKEIPFALLAMVLVLVMGNDAFIDKMPFNILSRTDGFLLISMMAIFLYYVFGISKNTEDQNNEEDQITIYSYPMSSIYIIGGLVGLFIGGKLLVDNATVLARLAGLSEAFIGLTIVAIGTSLPELATSIIATRKGQNDIAIGNVVGSNIFNIFWILGLTSTILPLPFNPAVNLDVTVATGATLLLFIAMFTGQRHKLDRWQGVLFILLYIAYIVFLIHRG